MCINCYSNLHWTNQRDLLLLLREDTIDKLLSDKDSNNTKESTEVSGGSFISYHSVNGCGSKEEEQRGVYSYCKSSKL